ncbi:MAG: glycosyltransferase family 39 protein, partial [Anaerolineae bacterium]|nr:glycosyltransferase family 39 protein [Anaerolineae bacterium]
ARRQRQMCIRDRLYYLLLHGWTALFGGSDLAVRALGALIGALAVWPIYGIGRRLGGARTAALAALLLALNPFLVWYSQEARMFMPATAFALVGLDGLWQIAHGEWRTPWAAVRAGLLLIGGLTAALYSYLYAAFLMPVAGLWLLVIWWERRGERTAGRDFGLGVLGLAVTAALFLPLAWAAWRVSGAEAMPGRPFAEMGPPLVAMLKAYAFGRPLWDDRLVTLCAAAVGLLALYGCAAPSADGRRRWGGLYLALWFGGVLLVGGLLLARDRQVFAEVRYQIVLAPALCLAVARALALLYARRRPIGWLAAAGMIALTAAALPHNWAPQNRREAWREAAAFVQAHAGPNDAVLIQADYVHIAFARYFAGPQGLFYPFTDRLTDPAQVDAPLAGLASFDAVWVVQSHHQELDPANLVLGWFAARYPLITEVFPQGIAIHAYNQRYRMADLPPHVPAEKAWPTLAGLQPLACRYAPAALSPRDDLLHPPSAWIHVTSYWRPAASGLSGELRPRLRVVDAVGQGWGESMARPNDAFGLWPPDRWVAGEIVRSDHDINLNPIAPPGTYRLILEVPGAAGQITCGQVTLQ